MEDENKKAPRPPTAEAPETKNVFKESEKDVDKIAGEVLEGKWGEGEFLRNRLRDEGYDHREVRRAMVKIVQNR